MGVAEQEKYLNPPGQAGAAGQVVRRINLSYIWLRVVVTASIMCTRAKKKERKRERESRTTLSSTTTCPILQLLEAADGQTQGGRESHVS